MIDQGLTDDEIKLAGLVRLACQAHLGPSMDRAWDAEDAILAHYRKAKSDLEAKLAEAKEQIRLLEICLKDMERDYRTELRQNMFAAQVLSGEFDPPTIAEIRKARGLEPL